MVSRLSERGDEMNRLYTNLCSWITDLEFNTDSKLVLFFVKVFDKLLLGYEKLADKLKD